MRPLGIFMHPSAARVPLVRPSERIPWFSRSAPDIDWVDNPRRDHRCARVSPVAQSHRKIAAPPFCDNSASGSSVRRPDMAVNETRGNGKGASWEPLYEFYAGTDRERLPSRRDRT